MMRRLIHLVLLTALFLRVSFVLGVAADSPTIRPEPSPQAHFDGLRAKAEKGDAQAQYMLGWFQLTGAGLPKNPVEAAKWFRQAAEQGSADAQYVLGSMYAQGNGVAKDGAEAARWYRRAAEQGSTDAAYYLGLAYAQGDGVTKDSAESVKWYRMAAEQGRTDVAHHLGLAYAHGEGVHKAEIEALAWFYVWAGPGRLGGVPEITALEKALGPDATLAAQQRSRKILREIEANKARRAASR
jgi:TPR repeat protein